VKIIYKEIDGSVSIITASNKALLFATIGQIAEKDVPHKLSYWIVDDAVVPTDRTFRDAWEIGDSFGEPDGFGGESNQFDAELLKSYRERKK